MVAIIITYIIRLLASILVAFVQADLYYGKIGSYNGKDKKFLLYHKKVYFLTWMIPFYGWIWYLYKVLKLYLSTNKLFNE